MKKKRVTQLIRIGFFLSGLLLLATGINLMLTVPQYGLSPWDSLFVALQTNFGFTVGIWMFVLNVFFLAVVWLWKRELVTLTTVGIVFLISAFVDGLHYLLSPAFQAFPDLLAFPVGALLIGGGIGVYVSASLGVAPQEGFMLTVCEKTGWSYRKTEILASVAVLFVSFTLNGPIHFGTLILTIAVGFIIQLSLSLSKRLLTTITTN